MYNSAGKSYFDLAVEILREAGQTEYYIDPRLKHLYSKNPIPRVKCKEALQIIANACRCVLSQSRTGLIQIKSNFNPAATATSNGETPYSTVGSVLSNDTKDEYATLATGYTVVDGGMFFLPRNVSGRKLNTGFVSSALSDANGKFSVNPVLTVTQEAICMYYGIKLVFGNSLPSGIVVRTYNTGNLVEEYEVEEEIKKHKAELDLYETASRELRAIFGDKKLPGVRELKEQKAILQSQKNDQYKVFREVREQWMDLGKVIQNRDSFLKKIPAQLNEEKKTTDLG